MTQPFLDAPVRSDADLRDLWRSLAGSDGFSRRSLWLVFFDASGLPAPTIVPVDDIPAQPVPELGRSLDRILAELRSTTDIDSAAVLLTRPGAGAMTDDDRGWARFLNDQTELARHWPVHLAT